MLDGLLTQLSRTLEQSLAVALFGAFLWGLLSILLSPCHLSSVPLLIGFLSSHENKTSGRALRLSVVFSIGIMASIGVIGAITAVAGRLLGGLGKTANTAVARIFFAFGFYLMDLFPMNWALPLAAGRLRGSAAALVLGLLFGVALGPCTFAFMAPVLGVAFVRAKSDYLGAMGLLGAFALGHCGVIVLAGTLTQAVQRYLHWTQGTPALKWIRRACGLLVVLAGTYLLSRGYSS
jgi:cytochrome c-type biogenesis protein